MKAITITIPAELDRRAADEARRRGISKSELIRRGLDAVLPVAADDPDRHDVWWALAGFGPEDVVSETGAIDEVVYGG